MDLDIWVKKSIPEFFDEAVYPATKIKIKKPYSTSLIILTSKQASKFISKSAKYNAFGSTIH